MVSDFSSLKNFLNTRSFSADSGRHGVLAGRQDPAQRLGAQEHLACERRRHSSAAHKNFRLRTFPPAARQRVLLQGEPRSVSSVVVRA